MTLQVLPQDVVLYALLDRVLKTVFTTAFGRALPVR